MRVLIKFVCIAAFLWGELYAMPVLLLDKDGKPMSPNYALLARDLVDKMSKADAQLESDHIDSDASDAPLVSDIGSRLRSSILEQTQESTSTTEAPSLRYISSVGGLAFGERGLIGYRGLSGRSSSPDNLSPEVRQRLHEEYQSLIAQIDAMQSTTWNGSPLFAGTQIHNNPHIGLNSTNHFPTIQNNEEHKRL
jgi:hypothetical protein